MTTNQPENLETRLTRLETLKTKRAHRMQVGDRLFGFHSLGMLIE